MIMLEKSIKYDATLEDGARTIEVEMSVYTDGEDDDGEQMVRIEAVSMINGTPQCSEADGTPIAKDIYLPLDLLHTIAKDARALTKDDDSFSV